MFSEANSPQFDTVFQTHFCNQSTFWVERNQNWNPSSSAQSQWSWWAPEKLLGKVPVVENGDQIDLVLTWTRDKSGLCWQSWSLRNLREHVPGRFLIWVVTLMSWWGFHLLAFRTILVLSPVVPHVCFYLSLSAARSEFSCWATDRRRAAFHREIQDRFAESRR